MSEPHFHDRDGWIWHNGKMLPWRDAKVHLLTHGLHYASSVFEGERAYNGKIFKLREHSQRLLDSGKALGFDYDFTLEQIDDACNEVIEKNNLPNCYIRPVAFKGSEFMGVINTENSVHVAIAAWPWEYIGASGQTKGLRLCKAVYNRPSTEFFPSTVKAAGLYTTNTLNKNHAHKLGYDDCLVLGPTGHIAESTSANMFLVIDGQLHTPVPNCFLNGITRQTVIALAKEEGIDVIERDISVSDLAKASEVFLTGTAVEVTPVASVDYDDAKYSFKVMGDLETRLISRFREVTGMS